MWSHNLEAEANGYLQVRSVIGTGSDARRSEWSATSTGRTTAAPAAEPLAAPDNVEASDVADDSITLAWEAVNDAGSYEVGQRELGATWGDADCGGGSNVVEDTECVAAGLDSGTDYDFRVRAVPSGADSDRYIQSPWSDTLEARTDGIPPRDPPPGGMGDLNVRWESTETSITWIWERSGEGRYDFVVRDINYTDSKNPCRGVDWPAEGADGDDSAQTSHTVNDISAGDEDVQLLCVRPHDEEDDVSFAWAVSAPATPAPKSSADQPARDADGDMVDRHY